MSVTHVVGITPWALGRVDASLKSAMPERMSVGAVDRAAGISGGTNALGGGSGRNGFGKHKGQPAGFRVVGLADLDIRVFSEDGELLRQLSLDPEPGLPVAAGGVRTRNDVPRHRWKMSRDIPKVSKPDSNHCWCRPDGWIWSEDHVPPIQLPGRRRRGVPTPDRSRERRSSPRPPLRGT